MTTEVKSIVLALKETPRILQELIDEINPALYNREIVKGKWSIHEHATHIAVGDIYGFQKRLEDFKSKEKPVFTPLSGENFSKNFFRDLDLQKTLGDIFQIRRNTLELASTLNAEDWHKEAIHPEYKKYTPYIMLRHLLMHDHTHLYKIEDMGFGIGAIK